MWMLSAVAALVSLVAALNLCRRLLARSARHPERRTGMLAVAMVLTLVQTGIAICAAVADFSTTSYVVAWALMLPAWGALGAVAGALAVLSLPGTARRDGAGIIAGILCTVAFGIGCCYALVLGGG